MAQLAGGAFWRNPVRGMQRECRGIRIYWPQSKYAVVWLGMPIKAAKRRGKRRCRYLI